MTHGTVWYGSLWAGSVSYNKIRKASSLLNTSSTSPIFICIHLSCSPAVLCASGTTPFRRPSPATSSRRPSRAYPRLGRSWIGGAELFAPIISRRLDDADGPLSLFAKGRVNNSWVGWDGQAIVLVLFSRTARCAFPFFLPHLLLPVAPSFAGFEAE